MVRILFKRHLSYEAGANQHFLFTFLRMLKLRAGGSNLIQHGGIHEPQERVPGKRWNILI